MAIFGLGLSMMGCSSPEGPYIGKWSQVPPDLTPKKVKVKGKEVLDTPPAPKIQRATLELRPDKTFTMKTDVVAEGTWSYTGVVVALITTKVDGKTPAEYAKKPTGEPRNYKEPLGLGISEDLRTLTLPGGASMMGNSGVDYVAFTKG